MNLEKNSRLNVYPSEYFPKDKLVIDSCPSLGQSLIYNLTNNNLEYCTKEWLKYIDALVKNPRKNFPKFSNLYL